MATRKKKVLSPDEQYQELIKFERFANDVVSATIKPSERPRKFTRKQIREYLKDPLTNYKQLQQASKYIKATSGNYFRLLKHLSGLLTYDYYIFPLITTDKMQQKEKVMKSFEDVALYLNKFNLSYNLQWFVEKILENGELYVYKLEDSKGIVFKEIPPEFCRVCAQEDGVLMYEVNFSMFNDDSILSYPVEFQRLYEDYRNKKSEVKAKEKQLTQEQKNALMQGWRQISDKGIAFNGHGVYAHGWPVLSFLFDDVLNLDDYKDMQKDLDTIENLKLIHQKIPVDDKGEMLFDADQVKVFHAATKKNLPQGIAITTNPLDIDSITLAKTNPQFDGIERAKKNIYDNSGTNTALFNSDDVSGEILKMSVITDETLMYSFLPTLANFINRELRKVNSVFKWQIKFLKVTHYNQAEKIKEARENLAVGGSRFVFLATTGMSPLASVNLLKTEQLLDIDSLLVPKKNANTLSKEENIGRPGGEVGDAGEKTNEYK